MKHAVGPALIALAIFGSFASAAPARLDATKQATRFSTQEKATLPESRLIERNEVLADKRFDTATVSKTTAPIGDRRSSLGFGETREKKQAVLPGRKDFAVVERKASPWSGKMSRFSTKDDAYRSRVATRFQDKIGKASPLNNKIQPVVDKRTTFDRINRFVFQKNSDQSVTVSIAGSEKTPADISQSSTLGAPPAAKP